MIKKFTDQNFDQEVIQSEKIILVDFWAPWCAPCLAMNPIINDLAEKFAGPIVVGKINVDENKITTKKYGIMSVPHIKIFKNGKVVKEFVGKQDFEILSNELNNFCEEENNNQEMKKADEDNINNISGCCPEKDYCDIDCRPDDDKKDDIEIGCSCGGNC
ncbi:MAG: thioredoxin [Patescibacteria group bacterium]|nr:thioredoxin [Patescibacteria group bacterium]